MNALKLVSQQSSTIGQYVGRYKHSLPMWVAVSLTAIILMGLLWGRAFGGTTRRRLSQIHLKK